jgi:hypothetical protein
MLGLIEENLKKIIGIDVEGINARKTIFGFPNDNWKEWRLDNSLAVLVPGKFITTIDGKENHFIYPEGDQDVLPSGRMPKSGFYSDAIIRQVAIGDDNLNPDDNLQEFKLINDEDVHFLKHHQRQQLPREG